MQERPETWARPLQEDPLEGETATHRSIPGEKPIDGTEGPGRLQSESEHLSIYIFTSRWLALETEKLKVIFYF